MISASLSALARTESAALANHLWQSTLLALLLAAIAFVFRDNRAGVRFGLWLAASLKFLIPFSLLIAFGSHLAAPRPPAAERAQVTVVMERISQPFSQAPTLAERPRLGWLPAAATLWVCGALVVLGSWCLHWLRICAILRRAQPSHAGREFEALREVERASRQSRPIPLRLSRDSMEPGIFGIFRPCLIWPSGISEHLSDAQLCAILAHELGHVRRRDNLVAALHTLVQAVFWFHPLVWWIGARLVEERERACDEQVLQLGGQPEVYAESILKACKFCIEAPLACVAGVAGSDLKRRIARIMQWKSAQDLTAFRKLFLASVASLTVAAPVLLGLVRPSNLGAQALSEIHADTQNGPRQSFDSATVKRSLTSDKMNQRRILPTEYIETNASLRDLIAFAYGVNTYQVTGGPDWIDSVRFDVDAHWKEPQSVMIESSAPLPPPPPPSAPGLHKPPFHLESMLQTLLTERFHVRLIPGSQQLSVYDLVAAADGAKLKPTPEMPPPPNFQGERIISVKTRFQGGDGELSLSNGPVAAFAGFLSQQLGHQVNDKTGLAGSYDITLRWNPTSDATESISEALQTQLGLKLEPQQGSVRVLTIDQAEEPAED